MKSGLVCIFFFEVLSSETWNRKKIVLKTIPISWQKYPIIRKNYPIIAEKPKSWQKNPKFLKNKHSTIVKSSRLLPTEPRSGWKTTNSWLKISNYCKKTQILPKNIKLLPKKTTVAQKYLFLVQNYKILSKNTQLLPKYATFFPKITNFCGKEPSSSKNIPILATQRDTNLTTNTHFTTTLRNLVKKYANCKQNNKILSNIYLKYIKN